MLFANVLHGRLRVWNTTFFFFFTCFPLIVHACAWIYFGQRWDKLGRVHLRAEALCVLNPVHALGLHLVQNHDTLKHNSHQRGDQSFFMYSFPAFFSAASWATQTQSLISIWGLTQTRHHAMNMKGLANTQTHTHTYTLTHANNHPHSHFSFMCLPHLCSFWGFGVRTRLNYKKSSIHTQSLYSSP